MAKAKARSTVGKFVKTVARRVRNNPVVQEAEGDIVGIIVPAAVSFGGSQILKSLVVSLATPKKGPPTNKLMKILLPHLGPIVSSVILISTWLVTRKVAYLKKHQAGILAGVGVATLLTLIQNYLMKPVGPAQLDFAALPHPEFEPIPTDQRGSFVNSAQIAPPPSAEEFTTMPDEEAREYQTGIFAEDRN